MHFAVDAHAIGRRLTGNEVYVRNLLSNFARLDTRSRFTAYFSEPGAAAEIPSPCKTRRVSQNPFVRLGLDLPRFLRLDRPNLVHVQYTAPLICPVPVVVSIHDISYLDCPRFFQKPRELQLRWTVARTVSKAARILTPSEFSRRGVIRAYNLPDDAVEVVPLAVGPIFRPLVREFAAAHVLQRFQISAPFILTVGDLQPRKNHLGLIRAFEELIQSDPSLPHDLVLVGKDTWFSPLVRQAAAASRYAGRIRFTGFVADEDLVNFYNACDVFAFPSFYEGFGIPILEAMACARPVACSNTSAMTEVAGASALSFNPDSCAEIVTALRDLLRDSDLRDRMGRYGLHRADLFSWEHTANKTLKIYHQVGTQKLRARVMAASSRTA